MWQMTTISNGTRIRSDHTTYASQLASVAANVVVKGDEVWTATADGPEVKAGDKWLHCTHNGVVGWMAYIHKGVQICKELIEITVPPPAGEPILIIPDRIVISGIDPVTGSRIDQLIFVK